MKSTGLFGKNSGRVGGVVYSNYRGEQIVRSYQPKVSNPSTAKQVSQRAKFKLVSQMSSALSVAINDSFMSDKQKESQRNSWVKKMLKKAVYSDNEASLPLEEIVLTNSSLGGVIPIDTENGWEYGTTQGVGVISGMWSKDTKVCVVYIGYSEGGNIVSYGKEEYPVTLGEGSYVAEIEVPQLPLPMRAYIYAYDVRSDVKNSYEDYSVISEEATLDVVKNAVGMSNIIFSETTSILIRGNV